MLSEYLKRQAARGKRYMALIKGIKADEDFRGMPYDDNLGNPTIAYGTLLPLTEEEGELLLIHRLNKMRAELLKAKPFIDNLPHSIQMNIFNMLYNLGTPRLLQFEKMFCALQNRDFKEAAKEARDSLWYKQVGGRAERIAQAFENYGE